MNIRKRIKVEFLEVWVDMTSREQFWTGIAILALLRIPKPMHCMLANVHNAWHELQDEENPHDSLSPPN